jgi:3-hydroxyisobutyrate dehydrogenase
MAKIGFLGTGNMGAGMARCLIAAGHDVTVYNRSHEKTAPLAELGAKTTDTPRQAAEGADAVIAMLSDDGASKDVWMGKDGAFAAETAENAFAVECSTLSHDWVLELAEAAGQKGFRYIDCPVTGLPVKAEAGELTLLVGAEPEDLEAARPLLEPFSGDIIHFGPAGAGTAYKLMVNLMGAVQIAGAAEGMLIAEKAGLDAGQVAAALAKGAAASPQVIRNARRMAAADHGQSITFSGRLRLKDTLYGLKLADKLGQRTPFGDAARDAFQKLLDEGFDELNESKVIDVLRS